MYAACAGAIGACSVILAGCTSKTLLLAFQGVNQFDQVGAGVGAGVEEQFEDSLVFAALTSRPCDAPQVAPYMFIAGMLCTVFGQQGLLNAAMALGPIMTVFPIFQVQGVG